MHLVSKGILDIGVKPHYLVSLFFRPQGGYPVRWMGDAVVAQFMAAVNYLLHQFRVVFGIALGNKENGRDAFFL